MLWTTNEAAWNAFSWSHLSLFIGTKDAWLETVDEDKDNMLYKKRVFDEESDEEVDSESVRLSALYRISKILESDSETVLQGVQRLGRKGNKQNIGQLEELSSAASAVLEELPTIYEESRKKIKMMVKSAVHSKMQEVSWVYKMNMTEETVHGPYTSLEMQRWKEQGYFAGTHAVYLQKVVPQKEQKTESEEMKDDLMRDSDNDNDNDNGSEETPKWIKSDQVDFEPVEL